MHASQVVLIIVAIGACENTVIRTVGMAFGTTVPFIIVIPAIDREQRVMIESSRCPRILGMACGAIRWELGRCMVGVRGSVVVCHMASVACCWCAGVTIRMALDASRRLVRTVEREGRVVVIEGRVAP